MKRAWDPITLTVNFWHASKQPEAGDELITKTGRRYLIQSFDGKKLKCIVLPKDEPVTAFNVFLWQWSKR